MENAIVISAFIISNYVNAKIAISWIKAIDK